MSDLGYKVISISLYQEDLDQLDLKVDELKRRGFGRANRSWLIRFALRRVDVDKISPQEIDDNDTTLKFERDSGLGDIE